MGIVGDVDVDEGEGEDGELDPWLGASGVVDALEEVNELEGVSSVDEMFDPDKFDGSEDIND